MDMRALLLKLEQLENSQVNECGDMSPMKTPVALNITAPDGEELEHVMKALAGKEDSEEFSGDFENDDVDFDDNDDSEVDSMSPIDDISHKLKMLDDLENQQPEDTDALEGAEYDNSPDEKDCPYDSNGDKQVTPKPQGFKQRFGDNPYKAEDVMSLSEQLLKQYREYVEECNCMNNEETVEEGPISSVVSGTTLKSQVVGKYKVEWLRNKNGTDTIYVNDKPVAFKGSTEFPSTQGKSIFDKVIDRLS